MAYHTSLYLFLFLPAVLLAYQLTPRKSRWKVLLMAGYAFFYLISGKLLLYLIATTVFTHYIGVWLGWLKLRCVTKLEKAERQERAEIKKRYKKKERLVLAGGIVTLLSILGYLKYYNFFARNISILLVAAGSPVLLQAKELLLPIGISFYTLQAIGYMADVYWGKIPAQRHLGKLALFLSFFPQIMEGPIAGYGQTADALWEGKGLKGEQLSQGCLRILWGLFKKMIVADRLYVLVHAIFEHHGDYSGIVVAAAAVAYTIQLYMEFSGCMDIIIGSGRLFGVTLPENFRQPFAARNAAEFWWRWHITLGVWLKTYVFYPMSTSGLVKKWNRFGRNHGSPYLTKLGVSALCLFPVWVCNGLWHGPRWSYLFYGMYYFTILLGGIALEPVWGKAKKICHIQEQAGYWKALQVCKTWLIIFVGELFFRANGLAAGLQMFRSMFQNVDIRMLWDGTFLNFGLDGADYAAIGAGCVLAAIVGFLREREMLGYGSIQKLCLPARWAIYYALILAVIFAGAYGVGYQQVDLIYAGF